MNLGYNQPICSLSETHAPANCRLLSPLPYLPPEFPHPPVSQHGLLENPPFHRDIFPPYKPPWHLPGRWRRGLGSLAQLRQRLQNAGDQRLGGLPRHGFHEEAQALGLSGGHLWIDDLRGRKCGPCGGIRHWRVDYWFDFRVKNVDVTWWDHEIPWKPGETLVKQWGN